MPFHAIKNWQYLRALKKLPGMARSKNTGEKRLNPARQFLLFFNGTDKKDIQLFQSLHQQFEKKGLKIKMLAYVDSREEIEDFVMALYNAKSVGWNFLPKPKLVDLVRSRKFDILFNINPEEFKHLHYLAVAANADFKVSTPTPLPNDFNLTVKTKQGLDQEQIFREMEKCLETLSV
jgi:hypothetical protein